MREDGRHGYRGYIFSRPVLGSRTPQHVQNLVIRDHAARHRLHFLLSAVEYAMPGSWRMLDEVMAELPAIEGLILYSIFLLPDDPGHRRRLYDLVLATGASLHAAVEDMVVASAADFDRLETLLRLERATAPQLWQGQG